MKLNLTKDWTAYLPEFEAQRSTSGVDSNACGYYSSSHCIETQLFFETGVRQKFSARALASMAYNFNMQSVDVINKYGLIPQDAWQELTTFTSQEFYAPVPQEIIALGKKFPYTVSLKWLSQDQVADALAVAPIWYQCIPNGQAITHYVVRQNLTQMFDQYQPAIKPVDTYKVLNNFQLILTPKTIQYIKDNGQFKQINPDGTITVVTDNWVLFKLYFGGLKYQII